MTATKCDRCPRLGSPERCLFQANRRNCAKAAGDSRYYALARDGLPSIAKAGAVEQGPDPPESEAAKLEVVARCPHARLPGCRCDGIDCGPGGRRPGRRVTLAGCRACLED